MHSILSWCGIRSSGSPSFRRFWKRPFFPKWLDILYQWLIQPQARFDEIAEWYDRWKDNFPESVQQMPGIQRGFICSQQLMHDTLSLKPSERPRLRRPDFVAIMKQNGSTSGTSTPSTEKTKGRPSQTVAVTFRMLVEEKAASYNLLFMPSGRTHERSRMPLYRVSAGVDGKGGIDVFIMDDAVWLVEGDDYRAVSLDDMILRASKK